jgi:hypothetical protein
MTITMNIPSDFASLAINPNSNINGDETFYLLTFSLIINHTSNSILKIIIPS